MIIESKKTGDKMEISDEAWANYAAEGLQGNFRIAKKGTSPAEVTPEAPTTNVQPKKMGRTSGEAAE